MYYTKKVELAIDGVKRDILKWEEMLDGSTKELSSLEKLSNITEPELLAILSKYDKSKNVVVDGWSFKTYQGEYTHILGGDGRSAAWDEKRKGTICDIVVGNFIHEDQAKFIQETLFKLYGVDSVNFYLNKENI